MLIRRNRQWTRSLRCGQGAVELLSNLWALEVAKRKPTATATSRIHGQVDKILQERVKTV